MSNLYTLPFDQISDRVVRIAKTRFVKADQYTLKLEGSKKVGYRSIFIAGAKDPILIRDVDNIIGEVRKHIESELSYRPGDDYQLVLIERFDRGPGDFDIELNHERITGHG